MLHVRDCTGLSPNGDICPFPWCRKVKHLLYHLVSCDKGKECSICCPEKLSPNLVALTGLNHHRREKFKERKKALAAAAAAKRQQISATAPSQVTRQPASAVAPNASSNASVAPQVLRPQPKPDPDPDQVKSSVISPIPKVSGQSSQGEARAPQTLKEIAPNITATTSIQQESPALSACLPGTLSSLSVSALPTLEEAAMEIDDINLSASAELMGSEVSS